MTRDELEQLKRDLDSQSRRRERRRYPSQLRARAVTYGRAVRARGGSVTAAADDLGLRVATLQKWMRVAEPDTAVVPFREVALVSDERVGRAVVTTPRGLRIEGLALAEVVTLIERIG